MIDLQIDDVGGLTVARHVILIGTRASHRCGVIDGQTGVGQISERQVGSSEITAVRHTPLIGTARCTEYLSTEAPCLRLYSVGLTQRLWVAAGRVGAVGVGGALPQADGLVVGLVHFTVVAEVAVPVVVEVDIGVGAVEVANRLGRINLNTVQSRIVDTQRQWQCCGRMCNGAAMPVERWLTLYV